MKLSILLLITFNLASCSMLRPEYLLTSSGGNSLEKGGNFRYEWAVNPDDKQVMAIFNENYKDCRNQAFKLRAMGSRFQEDDMLNGCMQRRGYKINKIAVK